MLHFEVHGAQDGAGDVATYDRHGEELTDEEAVMC